VPSLVGSAGRRRRALAHLSPVFDLHLYRARNPSDVAWELYDLVTLTQVAVDVVALSSGLDGNLGAPRDAVLDEMQRVAAAMAPTRRAEEHVHVVTRVLDHLLRHGEPSPYFPVEFADPDADWQTVVQPVRVLYETLAADGATLHVNVDNTAVALLLIATNRSLEDEHEAVIAVMQAQADTGRLDAAIDSADDALTLSRTYAANVRRMILDAERDVTRIDYLHTLRPELLSASAHVERRMRVDGTLLRHLEGLRAEASDEQDPRTVRQLHRATSRLSQAVETLAELQTDIVGATPRWRDAQAAQAFSAMPAGDIDPTADVLSVLLTSGVLPLGAQLSPPAVGMLLDFTGLTDRMVAAPRQTSEDEGADASTETLEDAEGIYEQFPEQFHNVAHVLRTHRIPPGGKARLSELLADADELFLHSGTEMVAELARLAGSAETARRRLRLLLALDAMMLWRPDGAPSMFDEWWAVDDGTRAQAPDLDVPDLVIAGKEADSDRS
jgi:septum formation topological specificity factor MinE